MDISDEDEGGHEGRESEAASDDMEIEDHELSAPAADANPSIAPHASAEASNALARLAAEAWLNVLQYICACCCGVPEARSLKLPRKRMPGKFQSSCCQAIFDLYDSEQF